MKHPKKCGRQDRFGACKMLRACSCLFRFGARKGACLVVGAPKVVWCTHSTLVLVAHNMSVCNQTPEEMWQAGPFRRMQDASHAHACLLRFGTRKGACWVVGAPKVVWCTNSTLVLQRALWCTNSTVHAPTALWCFEGSLVARTALFMPQPHAQHFSCRKPRFVAAKHFSRHVVSC